MSFEGNNFIVTENAAKRISFLVEQEVIAGSKLRISVEGGGCSGFQYKYDMVSEEPEKDDLVISVDGAIVVIDSVSLEYLRGSRLDYIKNLGGEYFEIKNPNAASGCGCGNSFSV